MTDDNPVRVIDVFIDELDLAAMGFAGVAPERPAYHPATLLKIYLYGYLNRIQSSRRLERETQRNIELMWLTGRLMPDFKTIADFRRDNGPAIRAACTHFIVLCRRLNLFTRSVVAVDGSKFKAVNTRDKNFTVAKVAKRLEQVEASVARYLAALDHADRQHDDVSEAKTTRIKDKIEGLRRQMQSLKAMERQVEEAPDKQVSLTDPDARSMATSGKGTGIVGYNVQIAVDAQHHLIVAHEVSNVGTDPARLAAAAAHGDDLDRLGDQRARHGDDGLLDELLEPAQRAERRVAVNGADAAWMSRAPGLEEVERFGTAKSPIGMRSGRGRSDERTRSGRLASDRSATKRLSSSFSRSTCVRTEASAPGRAEHGGAEERTRVYSGPTRASDPGLWADLWIADPSLDGVCVHAPPSPARTLACRGVVARPILLHS